MEGGEMMIGCILGCIPCAGANGLEESKTGG